MRAKEIRSWRDGIFLGVDLPAEIIPFSIPGGTPCPQGILRAKNASLGPCLRTRRFFKRHPIRTCDAHPATTRRIRAQRGRHRRDGHRRRGQAEHAAAVVVHRGVGGVQVGALRQRVAVGQRPAVALGGACFCCCKLAYTRCAPNGIEPPRLACLYLAGASAVGRQVVGLELEAAQLVEFVGGADCRFLVVVRGQALDGVVAGAEVQAAQFAYSTPTPFRSPVRVLAVVTSPAE
jgi:hypothetical protein